MPRLGRGPTGHLIKRIGTPMLITDSEGEIFGRDRPTPLRRSPARHQSLRTLHKASKRANMHIQPMVRSLVARRTFDWVDDTTDFKG